MADGNAKRARFAGGTPALHCKPTVVQPRKPGVAAAAKGPPAFLSRTSSQDTWVKDEVGGPADRDFLEIRVNRIEQIVGFIRDDDAGHRQNGGAR